MEIEPWIETQSGRQIFFDDPDKSDFCIEDIARALSRIPRFAGHTDVPYSVAQHSVLVSIYCRNRLWGLMHDAAEAFISDIPGPVKKMIPEIRTLEHKLRRAIGRKFNLPCDVPERPNDIYWDVAKTLECDALLWRLFTDRLRSRKEIYPLDVQAVDKVLLVTEHQWLFNKPLEWKWAKSIPMVGDLLRWSVWTAETAEDEFLRNFHTLTEQQDTITCSLSGCVEAVTEVARVALEGFDCALSKLFIGELELEMKEALQKNMKES